MVVIKQKKDVSIIIFAYNNIDYTINTLNSLLKNTPNNSKYNFVFNVYDDCSSDNTENYFNDNFKNINYIRQNKNRGFNYLCNLAFENNKNSDFLVLLNNDLKFSNNWLNILLDEMIKNNARACGPITNSPGHQWRQDIRKFIKNYKIDDNHDAINIVSEKLKNKKSFRASFLNGFCMVYDINWLESFTEPIFEYEDPNFGLEDIFFKNNPCKPLIVPSSYVFHYKQVTVHRTNWAKHHFRLFDSNKKYKIAVGIITYKRFELLKKCIESLTKQNIKQPFDIFIVDNDINKSAKDIIKVNLPKHINIFYDVEENKGIPFARNKIVSLLNNNYDYLAFIDDDEIADGNWLYNLLSSSIKYNADVIAGPVSSIIFGKVPSWVEQGDFLRTGKVKNKTGDIVKACGTGNVLIKCKVFSTTNPPFNEKFENMGGSDSYFFRNISKKGYKIKWCNEAKINEYVDKRRLSFKWNLMRSFRVGNSKLFALKLNKDYKNIFFYVLLSIIQIFLILILFILGILLYFIGYKKFFFKTIKTFMRSLGIIVSLFGYKYQDYK